MGARSTLPAKDLAEGSKAPPVHNDSHGQSNELVSDEGDAALRSDAGALELVTLGSLSRVQHALLSLAPSSPYWLEREPGSQRTVLHSAVIAHTTKSSAVLRQLLQHGVCPVDERDASASTALHLASYLDDADSVSALLEHGANIEARDSEGMTPLLWATQRRALKSLEVLVRLGADVSARDTRGVSAVECAQRLRPASLRTLVLAVLAQSKRASDLGIGLSTPSSAEDVSTRNTRTALALATLWHDLARGHPYLAYRSDLHSAWPSVGVAALRAVLVGGEDAVHVAMRLVHAVQDADTVIELEPSSSSSSSSSSSMNPSSSVRPQPYAELSSERVGVVVVSDHVQCASLDRLQALHTSFSAAFSSAKAVVVDARSLFGSPSASHSNLFASLLEHALCAALGIDPNALLVPTSRERAYVRGAHLFVTRSHGASLSHEDESASEVESHSAGPHSSPSAAAVSQGKRVVLLLNELSGAALSALASALQLHGVDFVYELSAPNTRTLEAQTQTQSQAQSQLLLREPGVPTRRVPLALGLGSVRGSLHVRLGESVMPDHTLSFRPDIVLVRADKNDDARVAVSAAVRLALRTISSQRRAPIPVVSARSELVEPRHALVQLLPAATPSSSPNASEALLLALTSVWRDFELLSPLHDTVPSLSSSSSLEDRVLALAQRSISSSSSSSSSTLTLVDALTELLALLGDDAATVHSPLSSERLTSVASEPSRALELVAEGSVLLVRVSELLPREPLPSKSHNNALSASLRRVVVDWRSAAPASASASASLAAHTPRVLEWLLSTFGSVAPIAETYRSASASSLWSREVAVTRVSLPSLPSLSSLSAQVTLVLDESAPAFVLHAAKHALLAVPSAEALLVTDSTSTSSTTSTSSSTSALRDTSVASATALVQVTPSVHVRLTTRLLEYAPSSTPLLQRVTRLPSSSSSSSHPALDSLRPRSPQTPSSASSSSTTATAESPKAKE